MLFQQTLTDDRIDNLDRLSDVLFGMFKILEIFGSEQRTDIRGRLEYFGFVNCS